MGSDQLYKRIIDTLKPINPYKVVLFGSYANGTPHRDSDLDLFVVVNSKAIPTTFKERTSLYLSVSKFTRAIAKQIPVDLLVFTIPMYEQFIIQNSSFSQEIRNNGIVLYESNNEAMA